MAIIRKKVWPEYFEQILSGKKKLELRLADFEIHERDTLILEEWDQERKEYTGRKLEVVVTYILKTEGQTFWPEEDVEKYGFQVIQFEPRIQAKFHVHVRGIISVDNYILAARVKGANYCFLPGGGHEIGETLVNGLLREIQEEIGIISAEIKQYLGAVENQWSEGGLRHYEINHVFVVVIPELNHKIKVPSKEDHLEFIWIHPDEFEKQNLLPILIRPLIIQYLKGDTKIWYGNNF